jgi:membrane protease YdiL (CAAX protease family)
VAPFVLNGLVVSFAVPFAEELFYRGLGVRALGFLGKWAAIVGTALAFALAHGLLVGIPALGFFGLALAWVRWQTESVWPGFIAHALYNGTGIVAAAVIAINDDEAQTALAFLL